VSIYFELEELKEQGSYITIHSVLSFAMSAEKFNHIRPEMTAENILIIKDGRLVYCN